MTALPKALGKRIGAKVRATHRLMTALERAQATAKTKKIVARRGKIAQALAVVSGWTGKAVASGNPRKHIAPECRSAVDGLTSEMRDALATLAI